MKCKSILVAWTIPFQYFWTGLWTRCLLWKRRVLYQHVRGGTVVSANIWMWYCGCCACCLLALLSTIYHATSKADFDV